MLGTPEVYQIDRSSYTISPIWCAIVDSNSNLYDRNVRKTAEDLADTEEMMMTMVGEMFFPLPLFSSFTLSSQEHLSQRCLVKRVCRSGNEERMEVVEKN